MQTARVAVTCFSALVLSTPLSGCGSSDTSVSRDAGSDASHASGAATSAGGAGSGGRATGGAANGGAANGGAAAGGQTSGGSGGGGIDGGGTDAGGALPDASADGGHFLDASDGAVLPTCPSDAGAAGVAPGFHVVVFSAGSLFVQPAGMVFGADGKLYVANSHSLLDGSSGQGEVLAIDPAGVPTLFATDNLMRGPDSVAFGASVGGSAAPLLVAVEDELEAALRTTDAILRVSSSTTVLFDAYEPANLLRGPGGAFGTDLYYSARTELTGGPPNPLRLFHANDAGNSVGVFTVTGDGDGNDEIIGAGTFTWGTGGALGKDLYLGTVADVSFSPGSVDAVFRVSATGKARQLAPYLAFGLAGSANASGPYGDFLYAIGSTSLDRIDAAGHVTPIVPNLIKPKGIVFGPDGVLYIAETGAKRILKVEPCAP
jgi:hypothetical protein